MNKIEELKQYLDSIGGKIGGVFQGFGNPTAEQLAEAILESLKEIEAGENATSSMEFKALVKDAERYQWFRSQHWSDNTMAVAINPKTSLMLGSYAPSGENLDELIDIAMETKP